MPSGHSVTGRQPAPPAIRTRKRNVGSLCGPLFLTSSTAVANAYVVPTLVRTQVGAWKSIPPGHGVTRLRCLPVRCAATPVQCVDATTGTENPRNALSPALQTGAGSHPRTETQ